MRRITLGVALALVAGLLSILPAAASSAPLAPCVDAVGQSVRSPLCVSSVRNRSSGLCLTPTSISANAPIEQERCTGEERQNWALVDSQDATVSLESISGALTGDGGYVWCAHFSGSRPGIGSHLVLGQCQTINYGDASENQGVETVPTDPEPYFHIQFTKGPPPCLSTNGNKRQGSLVFLAKCSTSENQAWYGTTLANDNQGGW